MSDYDQLPILLGILVITMPLWFPFWAAWCIYDRFFSEKKNVEKWKYIPAPPHKPKPMLFKSISEKNKFYNE